MSAADLSATAATACPVCGLPAEGEPVTCAECGWTLRSAAALGPVTPAMSAEFDQRLDQARHRHDARAAALAHPDQDRYARWLRGGRPSPVVWSAALREAREATAGAVSPDSARQSIIGRLRLLDPGQEAAIVAIGTDGIGIWRVRTGAAGSLELERERVTFWPDLVPADELSFRLAGWLSGVDRAALHRRLTAAVATEPADDLVVLCQPAGWRVPETAAHLACRVSAAAHLVRVADPGEDVIGSIANSLPLLHGCGLRVAQVDPATGELGLELQPLFHRGDVPGTKAVLALRRLPGDQRPLRLVVVSNGSELVYSARQPREPGCTLSAVLEPAGRIQFTEPPGLRLADDPGVALPSQVQVRPGPVDLVCAIELAGTKHEVDRRRDLVRALIELLRNEYREGELRIGLLGCTDHMFTPGEERRTVVRRAQLAQVSDALAELAKFASDRPHYTHAAPIEDLLHEAHRMLSDASHANRSKSLLLVAARQPHPRRFGRDNVHICPLKRDWQQLAAQLAGLRVRTVAAIDGPIPRSVRTQVWERIAASGVHTLTAADPRQIGENLGLLAPPAHQIGLPLLAMDIS
jgi:hypothetical protein